MFPRVVYWDADGRKDLLIGRSDGQVVIYLNTGTEADPTFDGGTELLVGPAGAKQKIDVGIRATPIAIDFNSDGKKDLVCGAHDGLVRVYINEGSDTAPDFLSETRVQDGSVDLDVPASRSSPVFIDLDYDGKKDLVCGDTNGQLLFYRNVGTAQAPAFDGHVFLQSQGAPIDLPAGERARPFFCDWQGDGLIDILVGYGDVVDHDGNVWLFEGVSTKGDFDGDSDVDQEDADRFAECFTGVGGGPVPPTCVLGDFDEDSDVDCADWDAFVLAWTEPGDPIPPSEEDVNCAIPAMSTLGGVGMLLALFCSGAVISYKRCGRRCGP